MLKSKRILHLMPDEKFIDYYIDQSELVCPGVSEYWIIRSQKTECLKFVKSNKVINKSWELSSINELANVANNYDKIFFHGFYPYPTLKFIKKLRKEIPLFWIFWGSDGYRYTYNPKKYYLPLTKRMKYPKKYGLFSLVKALKRKISEYKIASDTRSIIKRMTACATWVEEDYRMVEKVNKKMKYFHYSYFSVEQMRLENISVKSSTTKNIWLGNSSTFTNNHFDALSYLKEISWEGKIITPLSYGEISLQRLVIDFGGKLFGKQFIPVTDFIPLKNYHNLMDDCDIVWMNHIRQQGAGNTIAALMMGKILVLNPSSNLYKTYKKWGIKLCTPSDIKSFGLSLEDINNNISIIQSRMSIKWSKEAIHQMYKL